jgi:hypothetical protein
LTLSSISSTSLGCRNLFQSCVPTGNNLYKVQSQFRTRIKDIFVRKFGVFPAEDPD